jgi:hypothetical protein
LFLISGVIVSKWIKYFGFSATFSRRPIAAKNSDCGLKLSLATMDCNPSVVDEKRSQMDYAIVVIWSAARGTNSLPELKK